MAWLTRQRGEMVAADERPTLHLSGPKLRAALETLIESSKAIGGVEQFAEGVKLKSNFFREHLADGKVARLDEGDFEQLSAFMSTVRRRVARGLDDYGFAHMRTAIAELLDGATDPTGADARLARFAEAFPQTKPYRWVRDLGAEILHNVHPEPYPLMNKWVWDAKANTGVLREIWHGDNVDHMMIDVPDRHATFVMLREELSQFLADNGVFRDMLQYVDLLQAQVYAEYINAQGGTYLRTDFASPADPIEQSRRILGLDGISPKTGRSRYKTIDGEARVVDAFKQLS